jgi:hypothetical protein
MELTDKSNCHVPKWHLMASLLSLSHPRGATAFIARSFVFRSHRIWQSQMERCRYQMAGALTFSRRRAARRDIKFSTRFSALFARRPRAAPHSLFHLQQQQERAAFNVIFVFAAAALAGISENIVTCAPANCMSGVIASQSRTAHTNKHNMQTQRESERHKNVCCCAQPAALWRLGLTNFIAPLMKS